MKSIIAIATLCLMAINMQAQDSLKIEWQGQKKQWALQECIEYAHENNITVKRQKLNTEYNKNLQTQKSLNLYPNLNASSSYNLGFGRVLDQNDYTFNNETTQRSNFGVSTQVPIIQGLTNRNEVKKQRSLYSASLQNLEKTKNDITLQITTAYLQVLFAKELLVVAKEQYETSMLQAERTKKLVDAGSQAMGSYLEIKSQAAKEALNVTQQENSLGISLLNLAQLLDLEKPVEFDIQKPEIPQLQEFLTDQPQSIYQAALDIMPEIKSSQFNLESSEYDVKIAKGSMYPSLDLNGGWNSSVTKLESQTDFDFSQQFKDNSNSYVGISLRIPIFNGLQSRTAIKNAKIGYQDASFELQNEKLNLRKEIQQAYADAIASYNKYLSSEEAVNSFAESFRYTEKKFNVGLVNSVDYNVAKTDYTRAQSDLLQAKYEYILRTKILDFYKGIPIEL
ncbi:TolC family protein [Carboxylicivirga sp. A043]|uniref:TolC family protein n=1 Tax=Carboxylicivirga litoralis TaxID=2816963 RepID=UPI0021CB5E4F|nr:TolC family protein [Carboxylicivirga sp. A043]MCU4155077.1 TolC family protein [Carboxylicivirga sp. A043]